MAWEWPLPWLALVTPHPAAHLWVSEVEDPGESSAAMQPSADTHLALSTDTHKSPCHGLLLL